MGLQPLEQILEIPVSMGLYITFALVICLTASSDNSFCVFSSPRQVFACIASSGSNVVSLSTGSSLDVPCSAELVTRLVMSRKALLPTKCLED